MIRISVFNAHPRFRIQRNEIVRRARRVLRSEGHSRAEVSIVFTDDRRMLKLNATYLHHHYLTDVLSFPLSEQEEELLEGEVYVNLDQARRQAREYDQTMKDETMRLALHGVLHLVGYDDRTIAGRKIMRQLENKYLEIGRTRSVQKLPGTGDSVKTFRPSAR